MLIEMFVKYALCTLFALCAIVLFASARSNCNEFVCGSIVSKCLLTRSCQCELSDCFCCKDCLTCLGVLYTECCSCLELCPQRNDTLSGLTPGSQIGDFEGVPELFEILTADEDEYEWTTVRFPMSKSLSHHFKYDQESFAHKQLQTNTANCTVVYLNTCKTNRKCTQYCESMGSKTYRWFHNGCCECVGANCFNYGLNESRCSACPDEDGEVEDVDSTNVDDDIVDYDGENEDDIFWDNDKDGIN